LLAGELASPSELSEFWEAAPNAARGLTRLYQAWREALERLSDLSASMAQGGEALPDAASRLPYGEATAYFEEAGPWFAELEAAAEAIALTLTPRDDARQAVTNLLRDSFGVDVRVLPVHVMPVEQARFDRHSSRLFISERVPLIDRPFLTARQLVLLGSRDSLDGWTRQAGMREPEAARICRSGFARLLAEAILAPAGRLTAAARDLGYDMLGLSDRFLLRPSRIMARLTALGAGGQLPPAFNVLLDASGGVLSRTPGAGFPFPRFGPFCARLPVFDGLTPGRAVHAELHMPDGTSFLAIALLEEGASRQGLPPPRRLALIGWRREDAGDITRSWPAVTPRPIGVTCRLCERLECAHRVHPPVTRPAAFQEHVVGPSECELR
jgi:predicted transcriptional regulator